MKNQFYRKALIGAAVVVCMAAPASASIIIADGTFASGNYTPALNLNNFGAPGIPLSSTLATGGNPGNQSVTVFTQPTSSAANIGQFNTAVIWNPATEGAITSIEFSADFMGTSGASLQMAFALSQGGTSYLGNCYQQTTGSWANGDCLFTIPTTNFPVVRCGTLCRTQNSFVSRFPATQSFAFHEFFG